MILTRAFEDRVGGELGEVQVSGGGGVVTFIFSIATWMHATNTLTYHSGRTCSHTDLSKGGGGSAVQGSTLIRFKENQSPMKRTSHTTHINMGDYHRPKTESRHTEYPVCDSTDTRFKTRNINLGIWVLLPSGQGARVGWPGHGEVCKKPPCSQDYH